MSSQIQLLIVGLLSGVALTHSGIFGYSCGIATGITISQFWDITHLTDITKSVAESLKKSRKE